MGLSPRTEGWPVPWQLAVSTALSVALPATGQAAWERLPRCPHMMCTRGGGLCLYKEGVVAQRGSEIISFPGCEPLTSRDRCSGGEAATSEKVGPQARGEGVCASQLCSEPSELCWEPSGVPSMCCAPPLLRREAGPPPRAPGGRWRERAGEALREVGGVPGPVINPPRQDLRARPTHPRQGQGLGGSPLSWGQRSPLSPPTPAAQAAAQTRGPHLPHQTELGDLCRRRPKSEP